MVELPTLTPGEFQLVYNCLSLAIAAMLGSFAFFVLARGQVAPRFRPALVMSALVVGIAGYHYWRIFGSWSEAYELVGMVYEPTGKPFNDAYRYVDWLLTVPLLVAELVAVMALPQKKRGSLMVRLVIASVLMIGLGYPGEITDNTVMRVVWAVASTVPFIYILYVLWVELTEAAKTESAEVKTLLRNIKLLLLATWGFYPIAYALPMLGIAGSTAEVGLQVGYSVADILAKCGYGIMIYQIARAKMRAEEDEAIAAPAPAGAK